MNIRRSEMDVLWCHMLAPYMLVGVRKTLTQTAVCSKAVHVFDTSEEMWHHINGNSVAQT